MKAVLASLLVVTWFCLPPKTVFDPAQDLIAYYSFNECDARDLSGENSHGALKGGVGCWCGIEDDGLLFDGRDDHVVFTGPVNDYFTTSDLTISYFIKPETDQPFRQSLLGKRAECDEFLMFDMHLDVAMRAVDVWFSQSPLSAFENPRPKLEPGRWHHIAVVREGTRLTTYVNGLPAGRSFKCRGVDIANDALLSFSDSPCIGAGLRRFQGVLDELRIYERALTPEDIAQLYALTPIENAQQDCVS